MKDLAKKIADIDFTMLSTRAEDGEIGARPMSNNGDVEYDGDSWFFSWRLRAWWRISNAIPE